MKMSASNRILAALLAGVLGWACPPGLSKASEGEQEPGDLATALSAPASRDEALVSMAVLLKAVQRWRAGEQGVIADLIAQDRAWLDRLRERYGKAEPAPPVLDPAGWMVRQNLLRQQSEGQALSAPVAPELNRLLRQVFDRGDERLAAAVLPELLWLLEAQSTVQWAGLLEQAAADEAMESLLSQSGVTWSRQTGDADPGDFDAKDLLTAIVYDAVNQGPPDPESLRLLRKRVYGLLPTAEDSAVPALVAFLQLGGLIDGLHRGRYVAFSTGLLAVAAGLLDSGPETVLPVSEWLEEYLPGVSATFARSFSEVDPRLNSTVAAVYDIARNLTAPNAGVTLGDEVADAVAQLALLMPDIEYYFGLPVRDTITGNVDACIGMAARVDETGSSVMSRDLFDDCIESLVRLADNQTRSAALSGDMQGPFGQAQLQREVSVTPVQRINYALGHFHQGGAPSCAPPANPLPNPLEWSSLATLMAWFAHQMPVYFQTPENERRLSRMREIGDELVEVLAAQTECLSGPADNDSAIVARALADYRYALNLLSRSLRESVSTYRADILAPGADIDLESDALQSTLYRPDDLLVEPCEAEQVCEMSGPLGSSRALLGLFPEPYLVADQTGMGEIQLCYDNMEWVDRRSEPVRPGDENVANYFGKFAFDLKGRFLSGDAISDVFAFRFTSPDEYHYLFAAASEEVLEDSCPMEWVGSRVVTPLPDRRGGIVPNRLTYLAASRMLPSQLLSQNWQSGAEWRDWFSTGLGVEVLLSSEGEQIVPLVTEHLQSLYLSEQSTIYRGLLDGVRSTSVGTAREHLAELSVRKGLLRMLLVLFYPQSLTGSDAIRSGIAGQGGLLDTEMIRRFQKDDIPVNRIGEIGLARLDAFIRAWGGQAGAALHGGSVSTGVAHGVMRLDGVYDAYFAPSQQPALPALNASEPPVSVPD